MNKLEIMDQIQEVFRAVFDDDDLVITEETNSNDIEDWDSAMHLSLMMEIESNFNIKFSSMDMVKAKNIGELVNIICEYLK